MRTQRRRRCDDNDSVDTEEPIRTGKDIFFYCDVSTRTIALLCKLLAEARAEDRRAINVYINSPGGDVYAGISGMSHLRRYVGRVTTIADGFVASAATLLLLGGRKRCVFPHTHVLIHQLSTSFGGKYADLRDEFANTTSLMDALRGIYEARTRLPRDRIDALLNAETCLSVDECIREGVVHAIL